MSGISEFESVFKRALRRKFEFFDVKIDCVLLITDLSGSEALAFRKKVWNYLSILGGEIKLKVIGGDEFSDWKELQAKIELTQPDLIVSYRLLKVADENIDTSLGVYMDTLSQKTNYPILMLPHPQLFPVDLESMIQQPVLVATEHLYDDNRLVNFGLKFTHGASCLHLIHIEDQDTFDYYLKAIEKIPELDNEIARSKISEQLLASPKYYLESVKTVVEEQKTGVGIEITVELGHLIAAYRQLIERSGAGLLIFQTKDDTQMAMHSLGYSLAVEFREIPVLLI